MVTGDAPQPMPFTVTSAPGGSVLTTSSVNAAGDSATAGVATTGEAATAAVATTGEPPIETAPETLADWTIGAGGATVAGCRRLAGSSADSLTARLTAPVNIRAASASTAKAADIVTFILGRGTSAVGSLRMGVIAESSRSSASRSSTPTALATARTAAR